MQQLVLSEGTAARRRIPLVCVSDSDGVTPLTAQTFAAADIQVSKNGAAEANSLGTVVELTNGAYYYESTATELNTRGFLQLRSAKAGVMFQGIVVAVQVGGELNNATGLFTQTDGVESGLTFQQYCQATFATGGGKSSGAGTGTEIFRNKADTVNRVTATMTGNNRTAITFSFS